MSGVKEAILKELRASDVLPINSESVQTQLYDLLLSTINNGEGNSCLLIGPRGSGKSSLVNYTLDKIRSNCITSFVFVYLNGYVCETDQQALKEIAKQMCSEEKLEDLNLTSFAATMTFLLETLSSGGKGNQSVVFILDEFDLFTQHHNQHLLYNLFDLSQSKSTPLAVVGLTCRQDVMELMEKRVKSRFSHRQLYLYGPDTFDSYMVVVEELLCPSTIKSSSWCKEVKKTLNDTEGNKIRVYLERIYNFTRNIKVLKNILFWIAVDLDATSPKINIEGFEGRLVSYFKDSVAVLIRSLSKLECSLLIAMARLSARHANQPFNLEMVLYEYKEVSWFWGNFGVTLATMSGVKEAILKELRASDVLPINSESVQTQLYDLLLSTINNGEGNSCLLIGPRGSGKSSLVNYTLDKIRSNCITSFVFVYLNGYVCETDQQALKEIAKQMCSEEKLEDLNLTSFAATMTFLLETLSSGGKGNQSVVFILDEFDLFTQHHNQHLLYNLFDLSQSKSTPLAVVGLTCRQDVMELMEKRVKSRFSHRQLYLYGPDTFDSYMVVVEELLCPSTIKSSSWCKEVKKTLNDTEGNKIRVYLERIYNFTRNIKVLKNILFWIAVDLDATSPKINIEGFEGRLVSYFKDSVAVLIRSLSKLECSLLIAMARLSARHANQPFNLEMVLYEYKEFVTFEGSKLNAIPNRDLAVRAVEKLTQCQLVRNLSSRQGKVQKDYRQMYLNVDIMDLMTIVKTCNLPSAQLACTSVPCTHPNISCLVRPCFPAPRNKISQPPS
eukprot:sb/3462265/